MLLRSMLSTSNLVLTHFKILIRAIPLLWQIAPMAMLVLTFSLLIQGGLPALSVWITQQVVDGVATALQQGSPPDPSQWIVLVIGWITALLTSSILSVFNPLIWGNLSEQVAARFTLMLMD